MTSRLPPDLLRLFTPRPPLKHTEPVDCAPDNKPKPALTGIAQYASQLSANDLLEKPEETPQQRKERLKQIRAQQNRDAIVRGMTSWDPTLNLQATEDPYKTVIVARLHYEVTEKDLYEELGKFGPIAKVKMVNDMESNFRGYAFIEYEHESDMREAFKAADGVRILGRRVVVDVERGRTVKGWLPRRFAGGLGGARVGHKSQNQKTPGRFDPAAPPPPPSRKPRKRVETSPGDRHNESSHSRSRSSRPTHGHHSTSSYRSGTADRDRRYNSRGREYGADHDRDSRYRRDYSRNDRSRDRDRNRDKDRDRRHRSRSPPFHRSHHHSSTYDRSGYSRRY